MARLALLTAALLAWLAMAGPARAQQSEADVFVAEAILAYEDKRFDDALKLLQQALQIDGESVDALYYTGLVQVARRRLDLAVEPFEKARRLAPGDLTIAFQLGVVYFGQEQYDKAAPLLTQVFNAEPRTDPVLEGQATQLIVRLAPRLAEFNQRPDERTGGAVGQIMLAIPL